MRTSKLILTTAAVAFSATLAGAELVGSLHMETDQATNGFDSVKGLVTRTDVGTGDANTQGSVAGSFSFLPGSGTSFSPAVTVADNETKLVDLDRANNDARLERGVAVWDYDLTGYSTNSWTLKVNYTGRRGADTHTDGWYVSINGLGYTLDTTDVTNLDRGQGTPLVLDVTKYMKIGDLPVGASSGTEEWDMTEIIEAAISNGGLVRLVYHCDGYKDDIKFLNDSGLIGADVASGNPVETKPVIYYSETFDTGSGTLPLNGWAEDGGEPKEFNMTDALGMLNLRDLNGDEKGTGEHTGYWDAMHYTMVDRLAISETNEWVQLQMDVGIYQDTSGASLPGKQVRISLTDSTAADQVGFGFVLNATSNAVASSTLTRFKTYNNETTGIDSEDVAALSDGSMYPLILTITKVDTGYHVDGAWNNHTFAHEIVTNSNVSAFDRIAVGIKTSDVGVKIDNVVVASSVQPIEPVEYLVDDFETGQGDLPYNGWTETGPEAKEYNGTNYPGVLVVRDEIDNEKGSNTTHAGYWETIEYELENGVTLQNEDDWFLLEMDLSIFQDATGADLPGGRNFRLSFVDMNAPSNAGFGFYLQTGTNSNWNLFHVYNSGTGYGESLAGANNAHPFDGSFQKISMKVTKVADGYAVQSSWGDAVFSAPSVTNLLGQTFDKITMSITTKEMAYKIDNLSLTASVEPILLPPYEDWLKDSGITDTNQWGYADDPDADGMDNMHEWAFGGNPNDDQDQGYGSEIGISGDNFTYTFPSNTLADDLIYYIEVTDNLVIPSWTNAGYVTGSDIHSENADFMSVTNEVSMTGEPSQFIRLIVEEN